MNEQFFRIWEEAYFSAPPLGYILRQEFHSHWIRFHSLPRGKRYAQTDGERQELLIRNLAIASSVFAPDSACFVVHGADTRFPTINDVLKPLGLLGIDLCARLALTPDHLQEIEWLRFYIAGCQWDRIPYRDILPLVAEEEVGPLLFLNASTQSVLAPYDGGVDLILKTQEERAKLKREFSGYLSDRGDGL